MSLSWSSVILASFFGLDSLIPLLDAILRGLDRDVFLRRVCFERLNHLISLRDVCFPRFDLSILLRDVCLQTLDCSVICLRVSIQGLHESFHRFGVVLKSLVLFLEMLDLLVLCSIFPSPIVKFVKSRLRLLL